MRLTRYLGDRPFWRATLRLGLPIAFQNLLVSSFSLVDTVMIGVLGNTALAAVGMAGQWSWLMNIVFFGFNSGASVFYAQYWGAKDIKGIHRSFGMALSSALASSVLFMAVGVAAPEWVLSIFTSDVNVIAEGASYLRVAAISYMAICLNNVFCTLLRSTEEVKLPLYVSLVSVALNAALNALFIFGMDMGVFGAGLATTISAFVSPVMLLIISRKKRNMLCVKLSDLFGWTRATVAKYLRISAPVLLNETAWALGTVSYRAMYSRKSTDFYAAYTILCSVEGLAFVFFIGLCHASAVLVGKRVGSGDYEGAYVDALRFNTLVPLMGLVLGLILIASRDLLMLPFASGQTQAVLDTAKALLLIYGLEVALRNVPYIAIVGTFRAGGDTRVGLLYDMSCLWALALPITYCLTTFTDMPLVYVYLFMLLGEDLIKSVLCFRRLVSRKWIKPVVEAKDA